MIYISIYSYAYHIYFGFRNLEVNKEEKKCVESIVLGTRDYTIIKIVPTISAALT